MSTIKRPKIFIAILGGGLLPIVLSACGAQASPRSPIQTSVAVKTNNMSNTAIFPQWGAPIRPQQVPSGSASQIVYQFWRFFGQMGSQYSQSTADQRAYGLLSPPLQRQLPFVTWQRQYQDVSYGRVLTLYPLSPRKVYVEVALWLAGTSSVSPQSLGYQAGFMSVAHGRVTAVQMHWENLLGTVYRIQAWSYTLQGTVDVALHAYGAPHGWSIIQQRSVAPHVLSVVVQHDQKKYTLIVGYEANRTYHVLTIHPAI